MFQYLTPAVEGWLFKSKEEKILNHINKRNAVVLLAIEEFHKVRDKLISDISTLESIVKNKKPNNDKFKTLEIPTEMFLRYEYDKRFLNSVKDIVPIVSTVINSQMPKDYKEFEKFVETITKKFNVYNGDEYHSGIQLFSNGDFQPVWHELDHDDYINNYNSDAYVYQADFKIDFVKELLGYKSIFIGNSDKILSLQTKYESLTRDILSNLSKSNNNADTMSHYYQYIASVFIGGLKLVGHCSYSELETALYIAKHCYE